MNRPRTKHFLTKLDEFLAAFDPEELVKEGIQAIRFRYKHGKHDYTETFTPTKIEQERKKNAIH